MSRFAAPLLINLAFLPGAVSLGGLQVERADGSWISPPPLAGTFMVNIGDLFARK